MTFEIKYNIYIIKGGWSDNPMEANVNQELSNPWNATAKMTTDSTLNLGVGNTIKIRIDQDSNQHTVFTGVIEKKNVVYPEQLGCPYVEYDFKSRPGVIMQNSYVQKEVASGQATFQIYEIVKDLIPGTIAAFSSTFTSAVLPIISGKMNNYWDLVKDVCDKADWDFYINEGSTLHAFPRGSSTSPLVITSSNYVLKMELEEDATSILNYQEVIGGEYKNNTISINTIYWSSNGNLSTLVNDGRLCIKGSISTGEIYLKYSFPTYQDLLKSCGLNLGIKYYSSKDSEGPLRITYYFYSDNSNYFFKDVSYSGGKMKSEGFYYYEGGWDIQCFGYYFEPWQEERVPLLMQDPEWSITGSPKWSSISAFEVRIISPVENNSQLYLSAMTITSLVSGIYQSTSSQNTFGIRKGKPIFDTNYTSEEMCIIAASLIVEPFKSPLLSAGEVPTAYNFDYNLGEKATLNLLDNIVVYEVRKIIYEFSDNRLKTYLGLETKQRLTIEDILDFYKKSLSIVDWNLESWKHLAAETGLIDTRTGAIDFSQVHEFFPFYDELNIQKSALIVEYKENYEYNVDDQVIDTSINYLNEKVTTAETGYHRCGYFKPKIATWISTIDTFWAADIRFSIDGIPPNSIDDAAEQIAGIGIGNAYKDSGYISGQYLGFQFRTSDSSIRVYGRTSGINTILLGTIGYNQDALLEFRFLQPNTIFFFINKIYKGSLSGSLTDGTIRQYISFLDYWNESGLATPGTLTLEVRGAQIGTGWRT